MNTRFWRGGVLAVVVTLGYGALSQAQSFGTFPHSPASTIEGKWYEDGNPALPCYVDVGPGGMTAIFTDATGQKARGRLVGRRRVILNVAGGLTVEVEGDVMYFSNGGYWTR